MPGLNKCSSALRASVGSKNKGGAGPSLGSASGHLPRFAAFPYVHFLILSLVFQVFIFVALLEFAALHFPV